MSDSHGLPIANMNLITAIVHLGLSQGLEVGCHVVGGPSVSDPGCIS